MFKKLRLHIYIRSKTHKLKNFIRKELKIYVSFYKTYFEIYKYTKPSVTEAQANALAQGIITNGSIFKKVPLSIKAIQVVATDTTDFDIL